MKIKFIYRISSHNQVIEVDEASTSLEKISKKVIFFEKKLPEKNDLGKILRKKCVGTAIVVETFVADKIQLFDTITTEESQLLVHEIGEMEGQKILICQPEKFITFNLEKKLAIVPKIFQIALININDMLYRGISEDFCTPKIEQILENYFKKEQKTLKIKTKILSNQKAELLESVLKVKNHKYDALFIIGGTGIGKNEITIETIDGLVPKKIPGIIEMIRIKYGQENPQILLNRFIAGAMNQTLVFTLPNNVQLIEIYMKEILNTFKYMVDMLHGINNQ